MFEEKYLNEIENKLGENFNFNEEQKKIIYYYDNQVNIHNNLRIIAGAGSGKTTTITAMAAYIIKSQITKQPSKICMITFTRKAAEELKNNMKILLGEEKANDIYIGTFHSVFNRINEEINGENKVKKKFDEDGLEQFIQESAQKLGLLSLVQSFSTLKDKFSCCINNGCSNKEICENFALNYLEKPTSITSSNEEDYESEANIIDMKNDKIISLSEQYDKKILEHFFPYKHIEEAEGVIKKLVDEESELGEKVNKELYIRIGILLENISDYKIHNEILSFDDMLVNLKKHIDNNKDILKHKFDFLFVDEFQDTNKLQFDVIKAMSKCINEDYGARLIAIGDDDQAIYSFRGAQNDLFINLSEGKNEIKTDSICLRNNYRSRHKSIVDCANNLIRNNTKRAKNRNDEMVSDKEDTYIPELISYDSRKEINLFMNEDDVAYGEECDKVIFDKYAIARSIERLLEEDGKEYNKWFILYRSSVNIPYLMQYFNDNNIPFVYEGKSEEFLGVYNLGIFKKTWEALFDYFNNDETQNYEKIIKDINRLTRLELDNNEILDRIYEVEDDNDIFAKYIKEIEKHRNKEKKPYIGKKLFNQIKLYISCIENINKNRNISIHPLISILMEFPAYRWMRADKSQNKGEETKKIEEGDEPTYYKVITDFFRNKTLDESIKIYLARKIQCEKLGKLLLKYHKGEYNAVDIMTIHKSKGMSLENVIIAGCNQNELPIIFAENDEVYNEEEIENSIKKGHPVTLISEERRLMYVAITRTKNRLILLYDKNKEKSQFIKEMFEF